MMNSVGAEKDPYLQAYIQARMKNHVEEVKLQKVLANLEVGRRIKKIMLNLELYEDRKTAHKLKQEVTDLESKKRKAIHKFITSRGQVSFRSFAARTGFYHNKKTERASTSYAVTENTRDALTTAPHSGIVRTAIFPVTKGNTHNVSPSQMNNASSADCGVTTDNLGASNSSMQLLDSWAQMRSTNGHATNGAGTQPCHVTIAISEASTSSIKAGPRRSSSFRDVKSSTSLAALSVHDSGQQKQFHRQNSFQSSGAVSRHREHSSPHGGGVYRRSSTVPQIHHPASPNAQVGGTNDQDQAALLANGGSMTPATIPMQRRQRRKPTDTRSVRTLPNLPSSTAISPGLQQSRPGTSGSSKLWPGDPCAIQSIRRERKKPEEMLSLVKNGEEARRLIRDAPVTCSKKLQQTRSPVELGRSYNDLPALLPAIEKARHDLARREAASRDDVPHTDIELSEPMPVSQIQYGALRSLGGIRRNSVIA